MIPTSKFVLLTGIGMTDKVFHLVRDTFVARGEILYWRSPEESLADQAADLLYGLPDETVLVGHSLGGYLALEALRQRPGSVRAVVLINTSARPDTGLSRRLRAVQIASASMGRLAQDASRRFTSLVHSARLDDADLRACFLGMSADSGEDEFARLSRAAMTRADARPWLGSITCPVLVIAGDADRLTPVARSEEIAMATPNADLHVIADCGHLAPLEAPADVSRIISAWFDKIGILSR